MVFSTPRSHLDLPELIQIGASAKEAALLSRGSAKTGIAIDAVALLFQIPDIISPLAHNRVRIGFDLIIPFTARTGINVNDLGIDAF
jgi:hypothetical protein